MGFQKIWLRGPWGRTAVVLQLIFDLRKACCGTGGHQGSTRGPGGPKKRFTANIYCACAIHQEYYFPLIILFYTSSITFHWSNKTTCVNVMKHQISEIEVTEYIKVSDKTDSKEFSHLCCKRQPQQLCKLRQWRGQWLVEPKSLKQFHFDKVIPYQFKSLIRDGV